MMLELSPLLTAANASARSMPASIQGVAVEADPGHLAAAELGCQPAERAGVAVDDGDVVPELLETPREG